MISRAIDRTHTLAAYRDARDEHGIFHPATWAAWGRLVATWGIRRSPGAPNADASPDLFDAAATAYARQAGIPNSNRTARHHGAPLYQGVLP